MNRTKTNTRMSRAPSRIGIYAGAFDPVHAGHISFALQALRAAHLDQVVFLPERSPLHKPGVEHYAHRIAMLKRALGPHPDLAVLETVDRRQNLLRTIPHMRTLFPAAELALLMGSDAALRLSEEPGITQLLKQIGLVIAVQDGHSKQMIGDEIASWQQKPQSLTIVTSYAPDISSSQVRQALRANEPGKGVLASVRHYSRQEWLYVSPSITLAHRQP